MEHVFRSTVVASKPRLGRRMMVTGRESVLAVVGAGASDALAAPRERAATGRGHVQYHSNASSAMSMLSLGDSGVVRRQPRQPRAAAASARAAAASRASAACTAAASPHPHPPSPPRPPSSARAQVATPNVGSVKPLSRPTGQHAGGEDHISAIFGGGGADGGAGGEATAACGLKESEMRSALDPAARAAAAATVGAGSRVELRARRIDVPVGGQDNVRDMFAGGGGGTSEYKESLSSAQARLALDPRVRQDAAGVSLAGGRVQARGLGSSIRTTQPSGGASTLPMKWDVEPKAVAALRGAAATPPVSPSRAVRPGSLVGGFSGKYLEPAAEGRGQDSSGAAGVLHWAQSAEAPAAHHAPPPPPPPAAPAAHVDAASLPPAGGLAAVPASLPLKPLPHAHSSQDMLTEPGADNYDSSAHISRTLRRMAPAAPPALPPFATAYDGGAAAPPPPHTTGRSRPAQQRVIVDLAAAAGHAGAPRPAPRHMSSTFAFG